MDQNLMSPQSTVANRAVYLEKIAQVSVGSGFASIITFYFLSAVLTPNWLSAIFSITGALLGIVVLLHPASSHTIRLWGILGIIISAPPLPYIL